MCRSPARRQPFADVRYHASGNARIGLAERVVQAPLAHARASKQLRLITVAGHAQNSCYVVSLDWGRQFASSAPSAQ
jgi:hypothetical protein